MSLTQLTATIVAPVNQGVAGLAQQVQAWLVAHPGIDIQDVDCYRPQSTFAADQVRVRIAYTQAVSPGVGAQWLSVFVQTSGGITAQAQYNALSSGGLTFVPFYVLDITNHERGRNDPDSILVIGVDTGGSPLGLVGHSRAVFIAQPSGGIAPGVSALTPLIDAAGRSLGSALVRNVGLVAWPANQRNYVVIDAESGELIGLPSCAAPVAPLAPVVSTTTTVFPCPAYLPGAEVPVTP